MRPQRDVVGAWTAGGRRPIRREDSCTPSLLTFRILTVGEGSGESMFLGGDFLFKRM